MQAKCPYINGSSLHAEFCCRIRPLRDYTPHGPPNLTPQWPSVSPSFEGEGQPSSTERFPSHIKMLLGFFPNGSKAFTLTALIEGGDFNSCTFLLHSDPSFTTPQERSISSQPGCSPNNLSRHHVVLIALASLTERLECSQANIQACLFHIAASCLHFLDLACCIFPSFKVIISGSTYALQCQLGSQD